MNTSPVSPDSPRSDPVRSNDNWVVKGCKEVNGRKVVKGCCKTIDTALLLIVIACVISLFVLDAYFPSDSLPILAVVGVGVVAISLRCLFSFVECCYQSMDLKQGLWKC